MKNKILTILRPFICFVMINSLFAIVISGRFFSYMPALPTDFLGMAFIVFSVISQMALLSLLIGLLVLPIAFLSKRTYILLTSLIAALGILLLIVDTFVFAQYRFHINQVVVELVLSGQVVDFSLMNELLVFAGFVLLVVLEYFLISRLLNNKNVKKRPIVKKFMGLLFITLLASNAIHIWAAANAYQPVTMVKRYLPLFHPATANTFMEKRGWVDIAALSAENDRKVKTKGDLNYPLAPLQVHQPEHLYNIIFIVIDSWRFDTFNKENTPNIWHYAKQGTVLNEHRSTGNATRAGIFGLFYGMPSTYWHSFFANQQSPILVQRLQSLGYQMGIFASASLAKPEFSQTVFRDIPNLRMGSDGSSPSSRDQDLTQDWLTWYAKRDVNKPIFSFLFYDSPHGYDFPSDYPEMFSPMAKSVDYLALNNNYDPTPLMNRYKNSVHYTDSLIENIFKAFEKADDFDNTIFVITGDHAQELNDNKLNFWGHNGNFTDAQVKVPFIIITPEHKPLELPQMMTSHEDIAPTLLNNYLGVDSPLTDYSLGIDFLHNTKPREWVLSSSYNGYALLDGKSILEVDEFGQYQLLDKSNRPDDTLKMNYLYLQEALKNMKHFID
ncbi:DUF3413 domain-containing protein [Psychromonas sp. RZ22]|uniref:DUF3413 domain-containing protein n=1 Tax=Psychromonas algarum TaxID=2555643 RepID=UPI0010681FBA|nr:DUF3413 domain-containing protein [Psychromonas sp. RZ22]TEW56621.1 DUF3413 domain-containing protein [Psychromonas sp. RZ22]